MIERLYMAVLDMSKTAGIVIALVLLARLLLRKAPKVFSYALWAVVLFRLLCPVALEAPFSMVPQLPEASAGHALSGEDVTEDTSAIQNPPAIEGKYVWAAGMAAMLAYGTVSYGKNKRRVAAALPLGGNIWIADRAGTPFVMGMIRPKIYLPCNLEEQEQAYIILHEQHHIRRGDHIWKALAFLALAIHWFNPLVWAAFHLAGKDMEMSCDEAVIRKAGPHIRADYSASLLTFATGRRIIAGTPPAFGEGDTKGRIRNLAGWKKPDRWSIALSAALCLVLTLCLITDPVTDMGMDEFNGAGPSVSSDSQEDLFILTRHPSTHHPSVLVQIADGSPVSITDTVHTTITVSSIREEAAHHHEHTKRR